MSRDGSRDHGAGGDRRVGGRFWALAGSDEEDADGDGDDPAASPPTPTPSDLFCEFFSSGYDEDEVATMVDSVLQIRRGMGSMRERGRRWSIELFTGERRRRQSGHGRVLSRRLVFPILLFLI